MSVGALFYLAAQPAALPRTVAVRPWLSEVLVSGSLTPKNDYEHSQRFSVGELTFIILEIKTEILKSTINLF